MANGNGGPAAARASLSHPTKRCPVEPLANKSRGLANYRSSIPQRPTALRGNDALRSTTMIAVFTVVSALVLGQPAQKPAPATLGLDGIVRGIEKNQEVWQAQ